MEGQFKDSEQYKKQQEPVVEVPPQDVDEKEPEKEPG